MGLGIDKWGQGLGVGSKIWRWGQRFMSGVRDVGKESWFRRGSEIYKRRSGV